ncbi:hypothetical protein H0H93_015815 [Arthromyces matolae]|nr:hypothetical protein H0H93_015815 [Arthromyces matolae]
MPRRASTRAQPQLETTPAPSLQQHSAEHDPLRQLRTNWKWAAFSQFFFTFDHLFAMNDVSLDAIEEDLVHGTNIVLPRIMQRLLYTVSYDRKVSLNNWQTALRKQYRKRDPTANPIGSEPRVEKPDEDSSPPPEEQGESVKENNDIQETEETKVDLNGDSKEATESQTLDSTRASTLERGCSVDASFPGPSVQPSESGFAHLKGSSIVEESEESKDWLDLPMLTKLDSMHRLAEWQFQNPTRLRTLMRSDDDDASWRIEPIGYDSKKNAYWLIGAHRLWIQRVIPKPPRPKASTQNLKRKRAADPVKTNPRGKGGAVPSTKRQRRQEPEVTTGRSRAAKSQAKAKLDAQAKEMAELNKQANALARSNQGLRTSARGSPKKPPPSPPKPGGSRSSRRLRGNVDEDGWQAVPDEWLNGDDGTVKTKRGGGNEGTGKDGSELSELTELTEESDEENNEDQEELRELERKQKISEAMTQRKRSSRLLLRQTEKEEAERAERNRLDELERTSRARRQEARAKKEDDARAQRELARETRRKEREEKEDLERLKSEQLESASGLVTPAEPIVEAGVVDVDESTAKRQRSKAPRKPPAVPRATGSGSKTPLGETWELDCEICLRRGINMDDGMPMMSCGSCSKWQHIACHDRADQQAGRRRRNWDKVEFLCSQCRARRAGVSRTSHPTSMPVQGHIQQNPYLNLSAPYSHSNYIPYSAANGYSRDHQVSDARMGASPPRPTHYAQPHQQHQPYGGPLTFSHYQPQQGGFSSTSETLYRPSSHTQPYGYPSQSSYPSTLNGSSQNYQQISQDRWNMNTSAQRSTTGQGPSTAMSSSYREGNQANIPQVGHPSAPAPKHWQPPPPSQHPHSSIPPVPLQQGSHYRYHSGTSYPPGPT